MNIIIKTTLTLSLAMLLSSQSIYAVSEEESVNRMQLNKSERLVNQLDLSTEQKEKINDHFKVIKKQREQRHNIREANNGPILNDEQRNNMRKALINHHQEFLKETLTTEQYNILVDSKINKENKRKNQK